MDLEGYVFMAVLARVPPEGAEGDTPVEGALTDLEESAVLEFPVVVRPMDFWVIPDCPDPGREEREGVPVIFAAGRCDEDRISGADA
jgi:hypothetical protein